MQQQSIADTDTLNQIKQHISSGVNLQFLTTPTNTIYNNTYSVTQHISAVRTRLIEYISFGAVIELPSSVQPSIVQPLHVVIKPDKKPRLVIDLSRNLNDHLSSVPFSYSTVESAVKLSFPNCWYGKLDLSNCFLSFPLHESIFQYFIFALDNKYYQFIRMPFGLAPAPLVCTQLLSVIAYILQYQYSIVLVRYLDDFLFIGHTAIEIQQHLSIATTVFQQYGLVVNPDKTEGPVQSIIFLGIQLDSIHCTLSCTEQRLVEIKSIIHSIINTNINTVHHTLRCSTILSIIGKFSFAAQVLPGARPFMRRMIDITRDQSYSSRIRLSASFKLDLQYWYQHLTIWNGRQLWRTPEPFTIVSDASLTGFGFYLESIPSNSQQLNLPSNLQIGSSFLGLWSSCHAEYHSTHRGISWCELFSVLAAVLIYAPYLKPVYNTGSRQSN
jgi:hypothetical protein